VSVPSSFFDRLSSGFFPVDPEASGLSPDQASGLRRNAMVRLGLGMLAAREQGAGFGGAAAAGLGNAQQYLHSTLQTAFQNNRLKAQQAHQQAREKIEDDRYASAQAHQLEREKAADARAAQERADQLAQWERQAGMREREMNSTDAWRNASLGLNREELGLKRQINGLGNPGAPGAPPRNRYLTAEEISASGYAPGSVVWADEKGQPIVKQGGAVDARKYGTELAGISDTRGAFTDLKSALKETPKWDSMYGEGRGRLGTAYGNARSAIRVLYNTGVLQPGELPMLQQALENPNSLLSLADPFSREKVNAQIEELMKRLDAREQTLKQQFPALSGQGSHMAPFQGGLGQAPPMLAPNAPRAPSPDLQQRVGSYYGRQ